MNKKIEILKKAEKMLSNNLAEYSCLAITFAAGVEDETGKELRVEYFDWLKKNHKVYIANEEENEGVLDVSYLEDQDCDKTEFRIKCLQEYRAYLTLRDRLEKSRALAVLDREFVIFAMNLLILCLVFIILIIETYKGV